MSMNVPTDLRYAKTHEWARIDGNLATIGISDHAQHELTDVTFAEPPAVGRELKAGEACAVVESVKTASDVYSPVSGTVVSINQALADHPELVNKEPYTGGWFFTVKMSKPEEAAALLAPDAYKRLIGE
jgi:glycine cleavage system H protein